MRQRRSQKITRHDPILDRTTAVLLICDVEARDFDATRKIRSRSLLRLVARPGSFAEQNISCDRRRRDLDVYPSIFAARILSHRIMPSGEREANATARDCRICVIGAGAAGLISAHTLIQDGFRNVEVLSRDSSTGGVWAAERVYPGLTINK